MAERNDNLNQKQDKQKQSIEPERSREQEYKRPTEPERPREQEHKRPTEPEHPREQEYKRPTEPERPREQERPTEPERPREQERPTEPERPREQEYKRPTEPERPREQEYKRPTEPEHPREQEYKRPTEPEHPREQEYKRPTEPERPKEQENIQHTEQKQEPQITDKQREIWLKAEPEIIKEQRKLREVEKLYLHPEDTYNRYLQKYNREYDFITKNIAFDEKQKREAVFAKTVGLLLNSKDEGERKLGVLYMIYNAPPSDYYQNLLSRHTQELLSIAFETDNPEIRKQAAYLANTIKNQPIETVQDQLLSLANKVVETYKGDVVIDTIPVKLQHSLDNYKYFKEVEDYYNILSKEKSADRVVYAQEKLAEKLSSIDDILLTNKAYNMELSYDLHNIQKFKEERGVVDKNPITPQEIVKKTLGTVAASGSALQEAYRAANRYDNSMLAGKAVLETLVVKPLARRARDQKLIDEALQATAEDFVNTTVMAFILGMPVFGILEEPLPSDIGDILASLPRGVPIDAKGRQEYLDSFIREHGDVVEKLRKYANERMNRILKSNPDERKRFLRTAQEWAKDRGNDSRLLQMQIASALNAKLRFGGFTVSKLTISIANSTLFLERYTEAKNFTDQMELFTKGVVVPMVTMSSKEFMKIVNILKKKTSFFDMFKNNKYVAAVGAWIGSSVKWAKYVNAKYARLIGGAGRTLSVLLHADKPSDIIHALVTKPIMNMVHKIINKMLRAVGRVIVRMLKVALQVLAQIVAVILPYALILALILLPIIILVSMFLSPIGRISYTDMEKSYIMDNQPAMKTIQNVLFGSKYGINDIDSAMISANDIQDKEQRKKEIEKIKQAYQWSQEYIMTNMMHPIQAYTVKKLLTKDEISKYNGRGDMFAIPYTARTYTIYETETATYICEEQTTTTATTDTEKPQPITTYKKVLQTSTINYSTILEVTPPATCELDGQIVTETILKNTYDNARLVKVLLNPKKDQLYVDGAYVDNMLLVYGQTASTYYAIISKPRDAYFVDHTSLLYLPKTNAQVPTASMTKKEIEDLIRSEITKWIPVEVLSYGGQLKVQYVPPHTVPLLIPVERPTIQEMQTYYAKYAVNNPWTRIARTFTDNAELSICDKNGTNIYESSDMGMTTSDSMDKNFLCVSKKVTKLTINPKDFGGVDWTYQLPTSASTSTTATSSVHLGSGLEREYVTIDILDGKKNTVVTFSILAASVDVAALKAQTHTSVANIPIVSPSNKNTFFEIYYSDKNTTWAHIMAHDVPVFVNETNNGDAMVYLYWK